MEAALRLARAASVREEVPVGAVVIAEGEILGEAHNETVQRRDPTAHAEVLALRAAAAAVGSWRVLEATLYVTLEPCAMCAGAAVLARVELVVLAAWDPKAGAVRSIAELLDEPAFNHRPKWRAGTRRAEAEALLSGFFAARRASDPPAS